MSSETDFLNRMAIPWHHAPWVWKTAFIVLLKPILEVLSLRWLAHQDMGLLPSIIIPGMITRISDWGWIQVQNDLDSWITDKVDPRGDLEKDAFRKRSCLVTIACIICDVLGLIASLAYALSPAVGWYSLVIAVFLPIINVGVRRISGQLKAAREEWLGNVDYSKSVISYPSYP